MHLGSGDAPDFQFTGQLLGRRGIHKDGIQPEIDHCDQPRPQHHRARQVALRITNLAADVSRRIPTRKTERSPDEGDGEAGDRTRPTRRRRRCLEARGGIAQENCDQQQLGQHSEVLHPRAALDMGRVNCRKHQQQGDQKAAHSPEHRMAAHVNCGTDRIMAAVLSLLVPRP